MFRFKLKQHHFVFRNRYFDFKLGIILRNPRSIKFSEENDYIRSLKSPPSMPPISSSTYENVGFRES